MTTGRARVLAWALCAATVVLFVAGWVTSTLAGDIPEFDLVSGVVLAVFGVVGALVASRHPQNAIGWLFLGAGVLLALSGAAYGYAGLALGSDPDLAGGVAAAWLTSWVFLPAIFGVPPLLFLLFPDGRPLSRRWRPAVWLTVLSLAAFSVGAATRPGPMDDSPVEGVDNPLGVAGSFTSAVELLGWIGGLLSVVVATASLVVRFRRSRGEERLQLRWFTTAAVLFLVCCAVSVALFMTPIATFGQAVVIVGFSSIPVAAGIAILRYRLYDIDLVINRTLVYGALTASLVTVYLGSVLLLRLALDPVTGESDLAVAASTLAVAALFRPLRTRIQAVVDRRFYRRRYDATRALQSFSGTLRQQVDLQAIGSDLRAVVRDTMQPEHVSLWLRSRS